MKLAHINMASVEEFALARDEDERRALVRALVAVGGSRLAVFNIVDHHLHLLARCDWPARLAEAVRRVLGARRKDLALGRPYVKPIEDRAHLQRCVRYILRQTDHHQVVGVHPALWTGSAFLDVLGLRLLDGFEPTILRQELPRLRGRELYDAVGLEPIELAPASDGALVRAGPARIAQLAAAVFAARTDFGDRAAETVRARVLAARVARDVGVSTKHIAACIGVVPRAARRLAAHPVEPRALDALRRRLTLEERVTQAHREAWGRQAAPAR